MSCLSILLTRMNGSRQTSPRAHGSQKRARMMYVMNNWDQHGPCYERVEVDSTTKPWEREHGHNVDNRQCVLGTHGNDMTDR